MDTMTHCPITNLQSQFLKSIKVVDLFVTSFFLEPTIDTTEVSPPSFRRRIEFKSS